MRRLRFLLYFIAPRLMARREIRKALERRFLADIAIPRHDENCPLKSVLEGLK